MAVTSEAKEIATAFKKLWKRRPNECEISGTPREIQRALRLDGMTGVTFESSLTHLKSHGYTVKRPQGSLVYTISRA